MRFHCVGCGSQIPWDGRGLFAYTCPCGATLFANENGKFAVPASLVRAIHEGRELPHLDYYLGKSNYVSLEKQKAYEFLRSLGAKWSWECLQCREKIVERTLMEVREGFYRFGLHPELKNLIEKMEAST
jgi:hypothetical protein